MGGRRPASAAGILGLQESVRRKVVDNQGCLIPTVIVLCHITRLQMILYTLGSSQMTTSALRHPIDIELSLLRTGRA